MADRNASGRVLPPWKDGAWCLIGAVIGYAVGFGFFMFSANLFIEPMRAEFGWSSTQATFLPISSLVLAAMFPLSGKMADRFGPRLLAMAGLSGFALCFLLLATLPLTVTILRIIAVMLGICCAAAGAVPFSRAVVSWFQRDAGLALGLTGSGATLGGVVGVPLNAMIISEFGWRAAYMTMAALVLVIGLPFVAKFLLLSDGDERAPSSRQGQEEGAAGAGSLPLSDPRFWLLGGAVTCSGLSIGIYLNHLQPILRESGFSLTSAAVLGSIFAAATFGGRIAAGFLLDRIFPLLVAAGCLSLAAVGAAIIPGAALPAMPVFGLALLLIGLAYGAEADFAAFFALRFFGLPRFSFTFGTLAMMIALALAIGGFLTARSADIHGNYRLAVALGPAGFACAAAALLVLARLSASMRRDAHRI